MSRFSFIIPVFNCKKYLAGCVESILAIGITDYEILLVDDGSTDGSGSLCDELVRTKKNICCYHQENRGVSAARNQGLELATGDYVLFLDADDRIEPEQMKLVLQEAEQDSDIDLAIFGMSFDYYHHQTCYRRDILCYPEPGHLPREKWMGDFEGLYATNALSSICNKVFRREIMEQYGLLFRTDMFLYEDLEFSIRYLAHCNTIFNMPEPVYHYRQSEDEGNAGRRLKRIPDITSLINQIEDAAEGLIRTSEDNQVADQIGHILVSLYLVLAREKIAVSTKNEIGQICDAFRHWMENRNIAIDTEQQKNVDLLINRKVNQIVMHRTYVSVRHWAAVRIKSFLHKYEK